MNHLTTTLALVVACFALPAASGAADRWAPLREGLEAWTALSFDAKFALNVGDESGTLFTWESPGFSMNGTRMEGASLSKWPAATMITGLVNDGTLSFDDKANKHIKWWTKDPLDKRSRVTLRHLLSFTSGFYDDSYNECYSDYMTCAQKMYQNLTDSYDYKGGPGTSFQYLSCHLQFAGAMAVAASGMHIQELFKKYLYEPFGMRSTSWSPYNNPEMAGGITTTGEDFQNLLHRLLTYKVLPKTILDQMETDWTKPPVSPSGDGWFGHYAMGHWWECFDYSNNQTHESVNPLPGVCMASHIQAGPGEFGYYPLLDRSGGGGDAGPKRPKYYFNLALQEPDSLSGIPEYLRIAAKPVVDVILSGGNPNETPRQELLNQFGGLMYEDIDYIGSVLETCTCEKSGHLKRNEPYASLEANLPPPPKPSRFHKIPSRRDRLQAGTGLLLRDMVPIQAKLGACECWGRRKTDE